MLLHKIVYQILLIFVKKCDILKSMVGAEIILEFRTGIVYNRKQEQTFPFKSKKEGMIVDD